MIEERTSELEDMSRQTYSQQQKKKIEKKKPKQNIQELWNDCKRCDIWVMGIPEGEEKEKCKNYLKQRLKFPPDNVRQQKHRPGKLRWINVKDTSKYIFTLWKIKRKRNILKGKIGI